jgi:hypothetical protein
VPAILKLINSPELKTPPFAPPFLKAGDLVIGHTANILMYLGAHHGLAPEDEAGRLWAHQLQLSVTDFAKEIHDTHHPVGAAFYYEEQKAEAKRYAENFLKLRVPKFTTYFETVLARNGGRHMVGTVELRGSVHVSAGRWSALRISARDGAARTEPSAIGRAARRGRCPPAYCGLSCLTASHALRRERCVSALSGARRLISHCSYATMRA